MDVWRNKHFPSKGFEIIQLISNHFKVDVFGYYAAYLLWVLSFSFSFSPGEFSPGFTISRGGNLQFPLGLGHPYETTTQQSSTLILRWPQGLRLVGPFGKTPKWWRFQGWNIIPSLPPKKPIGNPWDWALLTSKVTETLSQMAFLQVCWLFFSMPQKIKDSNYQNTASFWLKNNLDTWPKIDRFIWSSLNKFSEQLTLLWGWVSLYHLVFFFFWWTIGSNANTLEV